MHGFAGAAGTLNGHESGNAFARFDLIQSVGLANRGDLVDLTTQADHHITADIRVPGDARQHALKNFFRFPGIERAAALMREGDDAIHVREIALELFGPKVIANVVRNGSGTVHAGNDGQIITCAHAPARAGIALKVAHLFRRIILHRPRLLAELVSATKVLER